MNDEQGARVPRKRITIQDVAAKAGVSRTAVSKVFNGTGNISKATSERIRAVAEELNWTPSSAAVSLRSAKTRAIGLVIYRGRDSDEISSISAALISGIETVLTPLDYGLLLYLRDRDQDGELDFYRRLATANRVDGVILTDNIVGDRRFDLMHDLQMPAVLLGTPLETDTMRFVDARPAGAGMDAAVEHLASLGHRCIAYVGGAEDRVAALLRRHAFDEAMAANSALTPIVVTSDYSPRQGADITAELLARHDRPTAIIYASDPMALAGMRRAALEGFRVPDDVSIVGFDGLQIGEWVEPQLTTVRRDAVQRGRAAAWAILDEIGVSAGDEVQPNVPELVVRGSTGVAPG